MDARIIRPLVGAGSAAGVGALAGRASTGDDEDGRSRAIIGAVGGVAVAGGMLVGHARRSVTLVTQLADQADLTAVRTMSQGPERRAAAWEALQQVATSSQAPLLARIDDLAPAHGIRDVHSIPLGNVVTVRVPARRADAVASELSSVDGVAAVHRDYDPRLGQRIGHAAEDLFIKVLDRSERATSALRRGVSPGAGHNVALTGSAELQALGHSGQGVTVGMLDSGVAARHAAIREAYRGTGTDHSRAWFDPIGDSRSPRDPFGHGTHVAGTIVGRYRGQAIGGAPDADLIVARAVGSNSPAGTPILRSLDWMLAPRDITGAGADARAGADIVSGSIYTKAEALEPIFERSIQQLQDAGVTSFFAAGNSGNVPRLSIPARSPHVITVAATDGSDRLAPFSSFTSRTPDGTGPQASQPDVAAPGVGIVSAAGWGGLKSSDGTSMATPLAAGIGAQLKGAHPDLDPVTLREVLVRSAQDIAPPGFDSATGAGRIDAMRAHELAPAVLAERVTT